MLEFSNSKLLLPLVLATSLGCASRAAIHGLSASIDSDTDAPALSLTFGAAPEPVAKPTESVVPSGWSLHDKAAADSHAHPHGSERESRTAYYWRSGEQKAAQENALGPHTGSEGPPNGSSLPDPDDDLVQQAQASDIAPFRAVHSSSVEDSDLSARSDLRGLPASLGRDVHALWDCDTAAVLLIGAGASLAVRETIDDDVAAWTAETPHRWGDGNDFFSVVGNPGHHFAAAAALWATSLTLGDADLHELSGTMFNALVLTNASTLLLKVAANTEPPNGESLGWPSGHTSSSVAMAAVLDEYYGPRVGIPAYALAGLIAWSRIDDREHDLSDVVFGAALGYAIGKAVAVNHRAVVGPMEMVPYLNPLDGSVGVGLEGRF